MSRIAIIGMACVFPGAGSLEEYWQNIVGGVDAISEVPESRWPASYYDPESKAVDRFYCRRGGFVDAWARIDPVSFGIMPKAAQAAEPDQLLTLRIGFEALRDAGYAQRPFARDKTGVIIGRGNYVSAGVLRLEQHVRLVPQLLQTLRDLFPDLPESALEGARERMQQQLGYYGPDVAAGMIPNLIASRLANRLDLHGPAYTVDAACASSLLAVEQACQSLTRGETDMMLVGGAHLSHDLTFWATFCQLGALSRTGVSRPLSATADGILAGEGVGMVVLRRLADAEAAGDRIYAVIEGVGSASDGRASSLVAPSVEGQLLALQRAWAAAAISPEAIGLVEAHGTGTPTGDEAEVETLARFFGRADAPEAVVGSVKSMIGHTMPAAGIAGLIKTALAVHHGVLPPTLHCDTPHPRLAETRFTVLGSAREWSQAPAARVAAVNAFGFGGINAHVVLRGINSTLTAVTPAAPPRVLTLCADSAQALLQRLEAGEEDAVPGQGGFRLAIVEPDANRLALARKIVSAGKPWSGRQQIYFTGSGLLRAGSKLAFLFPGVDSRFNPQAEALSRYFGVPLPAHCHPMDPAAVPLTQLVVGLMGYNRYLFERLEELGVHADALAGHSVGEWSAMLAGGMLDQELSDRTNAALDFASVRFPDTRFLAAGCDHDTLAAAMEGLDDIAISHDNCPHQVIACGRSKAVAAVELRLRERGIFCQVLPFVSGFHSPLFADHMGWYREFFAEAALPAPRLPVWSATRAAPFPASETDRRQLALDHLLEPVRFRPMIEALYQQGHRVFVQVGAGSLSGFVSDTLSGRPHTVLSCHQEGRSTLEQMTALCAALWVEGASFDTRLLQSRAVARRNTTEQTLALGVPLLRIDQPLTVAPGQPELPLAVGNDPLQQLVSATLADIQQAGRDVLALWQRHQQPNAAFERRISLRLDLSGNAACVLDHQLYPQRPDWPDIADGYPVVPLTMSALLLRDAAEQACPGLRVIELRDIQAYSWLAIAEPTTVEITLKSQDGRQVDAEIVGYFKARLVLASDYAPALPGLAPLAAARAAAVDAEELYARQWMFHGPAYQGVEVLGPLGDNGIDGELRVPAGKGALLDNMGQLAGYWVMEQPENCLAMPIGVERMVFHTPDPAPGERLRAQVRVRQLDTDTVVTDQRLFNQAGQPCISITGWRTRRYQMDQHFWLASRQLPFQAPSRTLAHGITLFEDNYDTSLMRDYMARRYLAQEEWRVYEGLAPRRKRQWLNGRIAAKDAAANFLREEYGVAAVYPKELVIRNNSAGAPALHGNHTDLPVGRLQISIAHKNTLAVAVVGEQAVGVDIERIETRPAGFADAVASPTELTVLGDEPLDVALTRAWVAKEVVAKQQGTGLGGQPLSFQVQARDGDDLQVNGQWVAIKRHGDYLLGVSRPADTHFSESFRPACRTIATAASTS